ncbi:hypothetical protein [Bradyrhizobium sp. cf659]|uniref:hypothetical protein n=1 Tax=Bradyrhizobium sp. cf659 TaxID=1761771 RepID=UPI0008EA3C8D|nr:hypothetical protein [Bradyrhizobium sp. cf659]SFH84355.1 hypothetical protein SAMN04487925_101745 [Bradyrhizobium sp. cf659]
MEQPRSPSDGQAGVASPAPPPWMHRTTFYAPDRRARMLEHMARARSLPQRQAATAPEPSRVSGKDILGDAYGYAVLFGLMALLFMSRVPLYLGAFLFFADGERIERALGAIGIRLEPGAVGPDIIKNFAYLFGWLAPLVSVKGNVPAWPVPWIPPAESWSFLAGIAFALRHRRSIRNARAAARIAMARIGDRCGESGLDDDQAPRCRGLAGLSRSARLSLNATAEPPLSMTML